MAVQDVENVEIKQDLEHHEILITTDGGCPHTIEAVARDILPGAVGVSVNVQRTPRLSGYGLHDFKTDTADDIVAQMNENADKLLAETQAPKPNTLMLPAPGAQIDEPGTWVEWDVGSYSFRAQVTEPQGRGLRSGGVWVGPISKIAGPDDLRLSGEESGQLGADVDLRRSPNQTGPLAPADIVIKINGVPVQGIKAAIDQPACAHPQRTELLWSVVCSDCGEKLT